MQNWIMDRTLWLIIILIFADNLMCFGMQLRNLVWATSKHDVYLISNYSVMHWSSLTGNLTEVLNFAGHVAPTEVLQFSAPLVIKMICATLLLIFCYSFFINIYTPLILFYLRLSLFAVFFSFGPLEACRKFIRRVFPDSD